MAKLDLVIRHGVVVTSGGVAQVDIGIAGEKIVQIGGLMEADQELDASGKLILPGAIDTHVHLTNPGSMGINWVDDFTSGSAAALAGGVTTMGNMTFLREGETSLAALAREGALASEQAIADVFMHPVLGASGTLDQATLDEIPSLLAHGCNSIKYFQLFPHFDAQVGAYLEATRRAGENGLITLIHCEDAPLIADATAELFKQGKSAVRYYGDAHPIISEVVATQRAVAFAEATGAPVYIVHLSSARALAVCAEAQSRGVPVYVEVRPFYLHLTRERFDESDGAKYVGNPPLREQSDVDTLWAGIRAGSVHTVCTDHAPWSLADKLDPTLTVETARPGAENLQAMLPMLYSEGVRSGKISLSRFVEVLSTNVAKLFGLYPRKGTIAVGSDADVVVFDPNLTRTIDAAMLKSNVDYSVYQGWEVTGWPVVTLRRGEIVFQNDTVIGKAGSGQVVRRGATQQL
ncbi:MAG TPA: amidohydrolase family protein [Nitrolancea sp.]|jgi:dihydropyrimidinase|nr:amidohydrolase family protein [Nitrolancea sp.]